MYGMSRDDLYEKLKKQNIYGRRYFYPLISSIDPYKSLQSSSSQNLCVATRAAQQVICLPLYPDLQERDVREIVGCLRI